METDVIASDVLRRAGTTFAKLRLVARGTDGGLSLEPFLGAASFHALLGRPTKSDLVLEATEGLAQELFRHYRTLSLEVRDERRPEDPLEHRTMSPREALGILSEVEHVRIALTAPLVWELERHDWTSLSAAVGSAREVPAAIRTLAVAKSRVEAHRAYWRIDNTVVVRGALFESAVPTAACLVTVLPGCSATSRRWVLELLVQLGAGVASPEEARAGRADLRAQCIREIRRGVALYSHWLEKGDHRERAACVDLLGICARD